MNKIQGRSASEVECCGCGKLFYKQDRYIRQSDKRKMSHACSKSCATFIRQKNKLVKTSPFSHLNSQCKKTAKRKNYDFDLTPDFLESMFQSQQGDCYMSYVPMIHPELKEGKSLYDCSVDRVDNNKGYVKDNVRLVSLGCNYMRNNTNILHAEEFMQSLLISMSNA